MYGGDDSFSRQPWIDMVSWGNDEPSMDIQRICSESLSKVSKLIVLIHEIVSRDEAIIVKLKDKTGFIDGYLDYGAAQEHSSVMDIGAGLVLVDASVLTTQDPSPHIYINIVKRNIVAVFPTSGEAPIAPPATEYRSSDTLIQPEDGDKLERRCVLQHTQKILDRNPPSKRSATAAFDTAKIKSTSEIPDLGAYLSAGKVDYLFEDDDGW